jgi:hypothetical protein
MINIYDAYRWNVNRYAEREIEFSFLRWRPRPWVLFRELFWVVTQTVGEAECSGSG